MRRRIALAWAVALALAGCDDSAPSDPQTPGDIDGGGGDVRLPDGPPVDMAPPELPPPGDVCQGPGDCATALCLSTADGGRCTVPCADDPGVCPEGWYCAENVALGGPVCQPTLGLCEPCSEDIDCGGAEDKCLPLGGQGGPLHCAQDCSVDACPAGFDCRPIGLGRQCVPDDDVCPDVLPPEVDPDRDGVADDEDNCPGLSNPSQSDRDGDGVGDDCDPCPDTQGVAGCPEGGLQFVGGQFITAGGEMSVGSYRLRLTLGTREPLHRMRTPTLRLRPISLGRTP